MSNNDKTMQVATAAAGAAIAYLGFRKGGVIGNTVAVVGTSIAATSIAAASGIALSPACEVRQSIDVMASPEDAFEMWSRFEDFPRFMENVIGVRKTGDRTYHWTIEGPLGERIEWDAEVINMQPGRLISWRSTTAEVNNRAEIRFEPTRHGTRVLVVMNYDQPIGPIGKVVAKVTGGDPDELVRQDLRRFKQLIETGEVTGVVQL